MRYSARYAVRAKRRRWPKRLVVIVVLLVAIVLAATVVVRHTYFAGLEPVLPGSEVVQLVTIERGATVEQIGLQLKNAGLIRNSWAFKLYVGSKNVRDGLQAGTYSFGPSQSVPQIVAQLSHGKVTTDLVTIVPGQRLAQIRTTLINYGFSATAVDAALNPDLYAGHAALAEKPAGASLEGYIYPDSYQKDSATKPEQIIAKALDEMNKKLTPSLRNAFAARGLSVYEAITLASVVEKEVSRPEDRAQVAQVFLTRLAGDIALQSDATRPSFNSYETPGLPPAPVSNVTIGSLEAVANPAKTNWLYFVSGDDGTTHFAATLAEHEANVAKYCHKLCSQ